MRLRLEQKWIDLLVTLPESGMGYQLVDLSMSDGRVLTKVLVFNAEMAEVPDEFANAKVVELRPSRR